VATSQYPSQIPSRKALAATDDVAPARQATGPQRGIFIVASPRRQSGKTFLATLATDFLRVDGNVEAFDLDPAVGAETLAEQRPALTTRVDLAATKGQVALFDRLVANDGMSRVVDVGHGAFARFFDMAEQIGVIQEARRRAIEVILLYAVSPHPSSPVTYRELQLRFPRILLVPVLNEAILQGQRVRDQYPFSRAAAVPLQIPTLSPLLKLQAEQSRRTFTDFHAQHPINAEIGSAPELRSWTKRAFLEFRELELRLLLEKLRASLARPA
jgi:hypothetical protein